MCVMFYWLLLFLIIAVSWCTLLLLLLLLLLFLLFYYLFHYFHCFHCFHFLFIVGCPLMLAYHPHIFQISSIIEYIHSSYSILHWAFVIRRTLMRELTRINPEITHRLRADYAYLQRSLQIILTLRTAHPSARLPRTLLSWRHDTYNNLKNEHLLGGTSLFHLEYSLLIIKIWWYDNNYVWYNIINMILCW